MTPTLSFTQLLPPCPHSVPALPRAVFYAGAQLITRNLLGFQDMLQTFFAIVMAAQGIGMASSFQIDRGKAEKATRSIFWLIDRRSAIDPFTGEREALAESAAEAADGGVGAESRFHRPASGSVTSVTSTGASQCTPCGGAGGRSPAATAPGA